MDAPEPVLPGGYDAAWIGWMTFVGIVLVVILGITIYRGVRMANRGQNPLTQLPEDLAHRVSRSQALAAPRTKAERLAELDALLAAGSISDAEHAAARARILAE